MKEIANCMGFSLQEFQERHEGGWKAGYGILPSLIRKFDLRIGAEIGVAFGGHSEAILANSEISRLYGVDSYLHRPGYDDPMNLPQPQFDELFKNTGARLSKYGDRFIQVRKDSVEAAKLVPEVLDFVFLDADHSYNGVWQDILAWYSNIRSDGLISGHDYGHPAFPGVKQAVDQYFRRIGSTVNISDGGVWWVQKVQNNVTYFIPCFNCAATVADAIQSIAKTNLRPNDEIVAVDDGSSDETRQVLHKVGTTVSQLRVLSHPRNRGALPRGTQRSKKRRTTYCSALMQTMFFWTIAHGTLSPRSKSPVPMRSRSRTLIFLRMILRFTRSAGR